ncbi:hypothetical protein V8E51_008221 [Hyaloscypha variabilis]
MSGGIPQEAVPVSVIVLFYSVTCFLLCLLLVLLLISFGERWTYVTIFSAFTALSTLGSIIQQLHYATSWVVIKEAQFNKAVQSLDHPGLALGGAAQPVDVVLFFIQFYCYNVMSLNILFWTVQLFTGSWGIRSNWLGNWHDRVPLISKVFSILFPGLIVGLLNVQAVTDSTGAFIIVAYVSMFSSLSVGGILLVLILYKYVKTRRLVAGYGRRGRWWASSGSSKDRSRATQDFSQQGTIESGVASNTRRSIYDRALLIRFSIGFMILAVFEVAIIIFTLVQANNNASIAASGAPNFSISSTITDLVLFIPGVTASLVAFLVFGTTKSWRQYRDLVVGGCGMKKRIIQKRVQRSEETSRSQGLEFQRLDSLPHRESEEIKRKDVENRVRMFVKETGPQEYDGSDSPTSSSGPSTQTHVRAESVAPTVHFHKSRPVPKQPSPGVIEVRTSVQQEDEVIQYERNQESQHGQPRQIVAEPRRFVMERLPKNTETDFLESASE